MTLTSTDKLEVRNCSLVVNGRPFVVDQPDELMVDVENGKLVTTRGGSMSYWLPEEVEGYFA